MSRVVCPTCTGTGFDEEAQEKCFECEGTGKIEITSPIKQVGKAGGIGVFRQRFGKKQQPKQAGVKIIQEPIKHIDEEDVIEGDENDE